MPSIRSILCLCGHNDNNDTLPSCTCVEQQLWTWLSVLCTVRARQTKGGERGQEAPEQKGRRRRRQNLYTAPYLLPHLTGSPGKRFPRVASMQSWPPLSPRSPARREINGTTEMHVCAPLIYVPLCACQAGAELSGPPSPNRHRSATAAEGPFCRPRDP